MFFIFLNFNLELDSVTIGLIPCFVGYILLYMGMRELENLSSYFSDRKKTCIPMAFYTGILYIIDLMGLSAVGDEIDLKYAILLLCEIISCIISLEILYSIIKGIEDIEHRYFCDLNYEKLILIWKAILAAVVITYVCLVFVSVLSLFAAIANFILTIILLYQFNITRKSYYYIIAKQQEVNQ